MIQLTLTCSLMPAIAIQGWRWLRRPSWQPGQATFHLRSTNPKTGDTAAHAWEVPAPYMLVHQQTAPTHGRYVVDWMAATTLRETLCQHVATTYGGRYHVQPVLDMIQTMDLLRSWDVDHTPPTGAPPRLPDQILFAVSVATRRL